LLTQDNALEDPPNLTQRFQTDVDAYLDWLHSSLQLGAVIPLDKTDLKTPLIPNHSAYAAAFVHIKQEVENSYLPVSIVMELEGMLDYLINYFSPVSSEQDVH
jgi:hypothetical protein